MTMLTIRPLPAKPPPQRWMRRLLLPAASLLILVAACSPDNSASTPAPTLTPVAVALRPTPAAAASPTSLPPTPTAQPTPSPVLSPTPLRPTPTAVVTPSGGLKPGAGFEDLVKATNDPEWGVRWDAVNALGILGDPRAVPALVERALRDDNPHPRWRSLWALSAVDGGGAQTVPLLLPALKDPVPIVIRNAAVALAFFNRPEARPELLKGLSDPDDYRRWEAVFSLKEIGSPEVAAALLLKLDKANEPADDVRGEAALALGRMGGKDAAPALLKAVQTDPSAAVRTRAALALPQVADKAMIPDLEKVVSSEQDTQVKETIQDTINQLRRK